MTGNISFNIYFACKYGTNEAILFQHILYWCEFNKANKKNLHDGLYWTYNKASAFASQFPFLSERQVRYTLVKLEEKKLIQSGNFNKTKYDQTKWYAVTKKGKEEMAKCLDKAKEQLTKEENPSDETANSNLQNCNFQVAELSDLYQMNTHNKQNSNTDDNALKSFTNVQDFKAAGSESSAGGCPSVNVDFSKKTVSPCNENPRNEELEETPPFSPDNFPGQASPETQAESMGNLNSDTIPDGGGFPFADEEKPRKKSPPKKKSKRTTPGDDELDAYFATVDAETARRMNVITETLYKKSQIIDPKYVRNRNYLRNQTKKLTDFIATSGRDVDEVESTFNFGFTDSFWCNVLVNVDTFLRNYAKIFRKMKDKEKTPDTHKYAGGFENSHITREGYKEAW